MRHDPAGAAIVIMLRSLKMPGMAHAVQDLLEQGSPAFDTAIPMLSQLVLCRIWLLSYEGATARHAIYGGQWRRLDRKQRGR